MNITKLKLEIFRNYDSQEIEFNKGINVIYGDNAHHITEALFKALARALKEAVKQTGGEVLSAKGVL